MIIKDRQQLKKVLQLLEKSVLKESNDDFPYGLGPGQESNGLETTVNILLTSNIQFLQRWEETFRKGKLTPEELEILKRKLSKVQEILHSK